MQSSPDGYYFTTGQMVESFETTAFALAKTKSATRGKQIRLPHHSALPMEEQYLINNASSLLGRTLYRLFHSQRKVSARKWSIRTPIRKINISHHRVRFGRKRRILRRKC